MKIALKPGYRTRNIDVAGAPWHLLGAIPNDDVFNWPAVAGKSEQRFCDAFEIQAESQNVVSGSILLSGDCSKLHGVGAGLANGTIVIEGSVGNSLGESMTGGQIVVRGNCGDNAGRGMKGGRISIEGNAGNYLGAGLPGMKSGMKGGEVFVLGDAGQFVGEVMRRGLIAVAGRTGECTGRDMRAGTILLGTPPGTPVGLGLIRGTILIYQCDDDYNPGIAFERSCLDSPVFISLIQKQLKRSGFVENEILNLQYTRYCGDRLELNRGEIFTSTSPLAFASQFPVSA